MFRIDATTHPFPLRWAVCALVAVGVCAASASGVAAQRVDLTVREGTNLAVALSPDGRTLAMDLLGSIWTLPVEGGEPQRLTDDLGDARQPAWSPDGRRLVFQSYRDGNWHIWTVGADGSRLRQLTFGPYDDREPHWSPDGRRIAFSSDRRTDTDAAAEAVPRRSAGNYDIWELELETGELRQLTAHPAADHAPAYSPAGSEIAYVSDRDEQLGVYTRDTNGVERLVAESAGDAYAPSWSPDGRRIVYNVLAGDRTSSRLMLDGRALTEGEDVFPFRAQWLSATELLYTADGKIKRRRLDGGGAETVEFTAALSFERPAYTRMRPDLASTAPQPAKGIVAPRVSPDGEQIAFAALGDLWLLDIGGEPRRLTDDPYMERDPAWSRDGVKLAYATDRAGTMDLWIRDLRTGEDRRVTTLPTAEMNPAWSPDGSRIAFLNNEGALLLLDVDRKSVV